MNSSSDPFGDYFSKMSPEQEQKLTQIRDLLHDAAQAIPEIKQVEECFKWGQPSFVVKPAKVGSTVRIDSQGTGVSVYFICNTSLVEQFRELYPNSFSFRKNREIHFEDDETIPAEELKHCLALAMTYHINKKK